jgi:uncharacterized protein (DUF1800 family)
MAQRTGQNRAARRAPAGRARPQAGDPVGFAFQELLHEPGSKTVLKERYNEGGVEEGEKAIRALCRHPATARFVATKLVTHFVADEPPAAAIDRVAKAFSSSDGDLKVVARALVDAPEAWSEESRKFRTPQDWLVAVMRAFAIREVPQNAPQLLRQLRQPFWSPAAPKGYGDSLQEWADPDSLLNRGELARTITKQPAVQRVEPRLLLELVDVPSTDPIHTLLVDNTISAPERIALAIAGPAFQWR